MTYLLDLLGVCKRVAQFASPTPDDGLPPAAPRAFLPRGRWSVAQDDENETQRTDTEQGNGDQGTRMR